jgi:hypothetical protein
MNAPIVHFSTGPDKVSGGTRVIRGDKILGQTPTNQIVLAHPDFKAAADDINAGTASLKTLVLDFNQAHIAYVTARSALGTGILKWDTTYNVFTSVAGKYVTTEQQANEAGLEVRGGTGHQLAPPIKIDLNRRSNKKQNDLRIHVRRPKGMRAVSTEVSTDPSNPAAWKELEGDGATHSIPNPAPGTYAVRALCKTAHAKSDYCDTVTIVVK